MELLQLIILAIVQGLTEFLPISSSAHLILVPVLTNWPDQGLAIDVAAHLGSLLAVVAYLRSDVYRLSRAGLRSCQSQKIDNSDAKLFWLLLLATFPVLLAGLLLHDLVEIYLRDPRVIAAASIGFGLLLLYADRTAQQERKMETLTVRGVMTIGLAQVLALVPGTSRAGITMTAGLMLGLTRQDAARFSFLMAIPVIVCAAAYELLKLFQSGAGIDAFNFLLTAFLSAISAWLAIHFFLRFLDRIGMLPFVIYRVVLGIGLLVLFA